MVGVCYMCDLRVEEGRSQPVAVGAGSRVGGVIFD